MNDDRFSGFPEAGLRFLEELTVNNERPWFEAHKAVYKEELLQPSVAFVAMLGERLREIAPKIRYDTRTNGSGSLLRIYRDTRFSKDKTPYKTNISGMMWEGAGKKMACPGFGFQLEASRMSLVAGQFGFSKEQLHTYREAVADDVLGDELQTAVSQIQQSGAYEIMGSHYKRIPRGYDSNHPRADLLRHNALYVHPLQPISRDKVMTAEIVDICMAHFEKMLPIQQWLVKVMI